MKRKTVPMIASKPMRYGTRRLRAGDSFDCRTDDVTLYETIQLAARAPAGAVSKPRPPQKVKPVPVLPEPEDVQPSEPPIDEVEPPETAEPVAPPAEIVPETPPALQSNEARPVRAHRPRHRPGRG